METPTELRRFLTERVRLVGGFLLPLQETAPGLPDVVVLFPVGGVFFVELRMPTIVSPTEKFWNEKMRLLGFNVHRLESKREVVNWLSAVVDYTAATSAKKSIVRQAKPERQTVNP